MSFKLSELLNPAPSSDPPPTHSPPSHVAHCPETYGASYTRTGAQQNHGNGHSYNAPYAQSAAVTSSYEAASALSALATSGSVSYTTQYSPTTSPNTFGSPILPSISTLPPLNATTARRTSYGVLPLFSDRPHLPPYATLPSPTSSLDHYRSSKSPDALRRHSIAAFEHNDNTTTGATIAGPTLPPLHHSVTPHRQGSSKNASGSASAFSPTEPIRSQHTAPYYSPPLSSSHITATTTMEDEVIATVIEQPAPMQIREPSVAAPEAKMTPQAPDPVERRPLDTAAIDTSPEAMVEDEPTGTPMEGTLVKDALLRRESAQGEGAVDDATLKAIEDAKNDFGRRAARQKAQPSIEEPLSTGTEETKSRKRPAPKVKKGQATVKKPPSKRRKVDDASPATTRRSLSPSRAAKPSMTQRATSGTRHGKKSKSNTPAPGSSPAPGSVRSASYVSADDDDAGSGSDGGDSNAAYCICRKGDNHTWMIACDGGCEDWFHGKCIDILEDDGELIDKYICPNCEKTNKSTKVTTWLPGCRNRGCRKPARIRRGDMSKYCSDKCGREFMAGELKRSEEVRRKANGKDSGSGSRKGKSVEINGDAAIDSDNDDLGPRGGTLKASELKALVTSTSASISSFRSLGGAGGVLSPPPSNASPPPDLTSTEKARLEAIGVEKDDLRRRRTLLKDREKFGQLVRENVARYAEREGVKPKDVCGYDNRLTWGEAEFAVWRDDADGAAALSSGVLELPEPKDKPEINGASSTEKMDIDNADPSSDLPPADTGSGVAKATLCTKKRCERHRQWQKQALADVRFEESQLADRMRELEAEERELREAAMLRSRMREGGLAGEGWVEVVGE